MSNAAKAHEPTMEEILASIRRIIADDEPGAEAKAEAKPAAKPAAAAKPAPKAPEPEAASPSDLGQDDIDAMLASFDAPEPPKAAKPDEDVLELTKAVTKAAPEPAELDFVEAGAEPEPEPAAAEDDAWGAVEAEPEPAPMPRMPAAPTAAVSRAVGDALLAPEAGTAVASAFSSLAHTILGQNARTLDDLVEEMLRPMLKTWLDDNLPTIVERLVRSEIERVSRGPKR
jgi:cell pole-organizing protein PopZ